MAVNLAKVRGRTYRRRVRRWCETCQQRTLTVESRHAEDDPDWACTRCGNITWANQVTPVRAEPGEIRKTYWALGEANPAEYRMWLKRHSEGP